jgi:hypothetical protein
MLASLSPLGLPIVGCTQLEASAWKTITAGTTQTQAGAAATICNAAYNYVLVTTADDGVCLPNVEDEAHRNSVVIVRNADASDALKVYPYYGTTRSSPTTAVASGGNINTVGGVAGTANAAFSQAAVTTYAYICIGSNIWQPIILS